MSSISSIGGSSSSANTARSVDSQISALNRRLEKTREALAQVSSSNMDPQQKETLSASYQSQISVMEGQIQTLQQQQQQQQQLSSGEAASSGTATAAQKDAQAAKTAESQAATGTPRSGGSGSIVDVYV